MDFKQKFITSTAMALTLISGYGRRSYAACVSTGVPNYLCSGTETSGQYLGGVHNAYITTDSGFSVNTNSGDAISISGDGSLSFIDVNNSTIQTTSSQAGIRANLSGGNGPMLISTDGTISGGTFGIRASNYGTGSTSVIANGTVSATNGGYGIRASTTGIGGLSITTGSNSAVTGGWNGILARNDGRGALSIAIGGDVTGNLNNSNGIYALNSSISTDLTIQTLTGSTVTGANVGISARNYGSGSMEITAAGDVTGLTGYGIFARNRATTTNLIINTESTATIAGRYTGIFAANYGTGAITIHAGGNVSGTGAGGRYGIFANNRTTGTNLTIETDAGTTISGSRRGISARNQGSGALSITAGGDVTSTTDHAIYARNFGTDLLIETAAGTNIASGGNGIYAHNYGSGIADVSIDGLLQGGNYGLFLRNAGTDLSITTATGSIISGDSRGIYTVNTGIGSSSITVNGEVTGAIGVIRPL